MSAESLPTQAPTIQLDRVGLYVANLVAYDMAQTAFSELPPPQALEALSSMLLQRARDNGIEPRSHPYGYTRVIGGGLVGTEETQPDTVITFLTAMTTERFVVEIVRDQTMWDRIRKQRTIVDSMPFGGPLPDIRKPRKNRR
ncbi:MAG TPA: hypothetical protein VGS08_05845 [Candidatus Saccharimonadales bacterium]|nr:hypothetical protein [Candidatus Saccharimonadales bacterium]